MKLKKCHFCRESIAEVVVGFESCYVVCQSCGAQGPKAIINTLKMPAAYEMAVDCWNEIEVEDEAHIAEVESAFAQFMPK
jgi:hypothetical protein